jgi:hypothetical protein
MLMVITGALSFSIGMVLLTLQAQTVQNCPPFYVVESIDYINGIGNGLLSFLVNGTYHQNHF